MKVVILAGGLGTRISEESHLRPKPMIEIGGAPILWHIMKIYSYYGYNDFIICCGYKGHMIKEYFADYYLHRSDITFDFSDNNKLVVHNNVAEPWRVTVVDTGLNTQTGGRVKRVQKYIGDEPFMLTYGDGVSNVDLDALVRTHQTSGKAVTLTASWILRIRPVRSQRSGRKHARTAVGLTRDSWCWNRRCLNTWTETAAFWSARRLNK